jgi:hypothetical protein
MSIRNDRRREHRKDQRMNANKLDDLATELTRELMDQGKLIMAGWKMFEQMFIPLQVGDAQRNDMRIAFFSGAEHTFNSIVTALDDENEDATASDCSRMDKLDAEITLFRSFLEKEMKHRRERR